MGSEGNDAIWVSCIALSSFLTCHFFVLLCTENYLEGAIGQFCSGDSLNLVRRAYLNSSDKRYFLNVDLLHA